MDMDIEILTADLDSAIRVAASEGGYAAVAAAAAEDAGNRLGNAEALSHGTVDLRDIQEAIDLLDIAADRAAEAAKSWAEAAAAARALRAAAAVARG